MTGAFRIVAGLVTGLVVLAVLAACQPSGPGGGATAPLAVPAITVTVLGAAPSASDGEEAQASLAAAAPDPAGATSAVAPQAKADGALPREPQDADTAPAPSPAQVACERGRGVWTQGETGGSACVRYTRDAGRECRRSGDCEGECLARSGTCAPIHPLLGCNDILDDMGRPMRQCLN